MTSFHTAAMPTKSGICKVSTSSYKLHKDVWGFWNDSVSQAFTPFCEHAQATGIYGVLLFICNIRDKDV